VNREIDSAQVRLVGVEGEMIGVVPLREALWAAEFKFEAQKKKNEARKRQKVIDVKEIKLRPNIDDNDYNVKMRSARRFLEEGDKVKVTMRFRGRELAHQEIGMNVLVKVRDELQDLSKVEQMPKMEGRQMIMVLAAK
jgi:translation initiation factor IF-3